MSEDEVIAEYMETCEDCLTALAHYDGIFIVCLIVCFVLGFMSGRMEREHEVLDQGWAWFKRRKK